MFNTKLAYAFSSCNLNLFLAKDYCISLVKYGAAFFRAMVFLEDTPRGPTYRTNKFKRMAL